MGKKGVGSRFSGRGFSGRARVFDVHADKPLRPVGIFKRLVGRDLRKIGLHFQLGGCDQRPGGLKIGGDLFSQRLGRKEKRLVGFKKDLRCLFKRLSRKEKRNRRESKPTVRLKK